MKKLLKKAFTVSVVAVTIMWSVGLAALVPTVVNAVDPVCPTVSAGSIIKAIPPTGADPKLYTAMYMVTSDLKKAYFPDGAALKSWYGNYTGASIDSLRVNMKPECITKFESATPAGVSPFPGSRLVKIGQSPTLFMVESGNKWTEVSVDVAKALFGTSYTNYVSTYSEYQDFASSKGTKVDSLTKLSFEGLLVQKTGTSEVYQVVGGKLNKVEGTLPTYITTNDVRTVAATAFDATEKATTTVTAASTYANTLQTVGTGTGTTVPTVAGAVAVSLAADTPAAGWIAKGAYNADFTKLTVKNTSAAKVRIDKIVVKRDGLGADADITAVRLYDGATQVGSDQALNTNTHLATFNNINWDIDAGVTKTLTVKADTYASAAGTNDYLSVTVMELEGTGTLTVSLPISGNAMQYHAVTVAAVDVDAQSTPGATPLISGATEQELACFNINVGAQEAVNVDSLTITNNDTIGNDELSNFVVKQGTEVLGKNTATFNSSNKVTVIFDKPYYMKKSTNKDLCVYGDIKGGITVTKYITLQLAESKDVIVRGEDSKAQIVVTSNDGSTFTAESGQQMTISQGTLTVTRNTATLPVVTSLIDGVTKNKLTAYKFSAGATEGVKITRLRLTVSGADSTDLSNFELYKYDEITAKETQIGNSQSISGTSVTFEDTSDGLFDIAASKNVVVHVYADINTSAAWPNNSGAVYIGSTNSNLIIKGKGSKSGDYIPAASVTLSSVGSTASDNVLFSNSNQGTLTVSAANDTPASANKAKGVVDQDFLHVKLYAASENMNVTAMTFRAYKDSGTGTALAVTTNDNLVNNVRLYDITNAASPTLLGTAVSSLSSGAATFSFTVTVLKDNYKVLKVVGDIPTTASSTTGVGANYLKFVAASSTTDITTTGAASGQDITESGSATGNVMTIAAPSLAVTWASGSTNSIVANAQQQTLGTMQLTAGAYEDVKVTSVKVSADDATPVAAYSTADADLTNFYLVGEDGTQYGVTKNLTDGGTGAVDYALFEGIDTLTVTKGTTKSVYVKANIATTTASTYYVGTAATDDVVGSGATSGSSATITGTGTGRANSIQTSAYLTLALDASNPATRLVSVGANGSTSEETLLVLSADTLYEDVDITKLVFAVTSSAADYVERFFQDSGVKLYHKVGTAPETLVGSASIVSSTIAGLDGQDKYMYVAVFSLDNGVLRIGKSTDDLVTLKGKLFGTDTGLSSGTSPLFKLGTGTNADDDLVIEAKGVSSNATLTDNYLNTTSALNLSGNQVKFYKSYPTFTYVSPGTTLVNGVENDIYSYKVRANGGNVALKQLKFTMDLVDNIGTYDSGMKCYGFKLYRGDTEITSDVLFNDNRGVQQNGTSDNAFLTATGTGKAIYLTWTTTGEEQIPSGAEYTYTVKATCTGFNTDADNDYIRIRLDNDDTSTELAVAAASTFYLSPWHSTTGQMNILGLDDSTLDGTLAATSTASLLWSDRSASGHSAATGTFAGGDASSTADWFNGYYVKDAPTNYSMLTR